MKVMTAQVTAKSDGEIRDDHPSYDHINGYYQRRHQSVAVMASELKEGGDGGVRGAAHVVGPELPIVAPLARVPVRTLQDRLQGSRGGV